MEKLYGLERTTMERQLSRADLPGLAEEEVRRRVTFVVCGGGATGVEIAAEVHDLLEEELREVFPQVARLAPGVLHSALKACNDYAAGIESAAKVKCPALFILGERDQMTPRKAATPLIHALAGARTVALPSGHSIMAEAPDATLDALIEFIPAPVPAK